MTCGDWRRLKCIARMNCMEWRLGSMLRHLHGRTKVLMHRAYITDNVKGGFCAASGSYICHKWVDAY